MKLRHWISAIAFAGFLTACGRNEPPPLPDAPGFDSEAPLPSGDVADMEETAAAFQTFADEIFSLADGTEANFDDINAALPDLVSISWDGKSFDAENGATLFDGLRVTVNTEPAFGLQADQARIWGLNDQFLAARLRGEQLDAAGPVLSRMELTGLRYFGVADALNTLFNALVTSIEDEGDVGDVNLAVDTFEVTADRMVLSDLTLRPYEYSPAPDSLYDFMDVSEEEMETARNGVELVQQVVAVGRTVAFSKAVVYDAKVDVDMRQGSADSMTVDQVIDATVGFYGYEDVSGLDIGRSVMYDLRQSQGIVMMSSQGDLEEAGFTDGIRYNQEESTRFTVVEGLMLDKLGGFLARGEFPTMAEKDLMSLGTWSSRDYKLRLNDGDIFSADRVRFDGSQFSWLIPNRLAFDIEGAALEVEAVAEFAMSFIPTDAEADPESAEVVQNIQTAVSKLDEYGLKTLPFDFSLSGDWNDGTGKSAFAFTADSTGFGSEQMSLNITLPGYAAIQSAMNAEDKEAAFEAAFEDAFELGGARYFQSDHGGYDKLFGYAIEVGKLYPQEGWGAMLGSMTTERMRQYIATAVRSGKSAAAQEMPVAADWLESLAKYFETPGGSFEIRVQPKVTVNSAYLDAADTTDDPQKIVDDLGITVTYSPE